MFKAKPVLIIWQDSATSHGWIPPEDNLDSSLARTLGFLVAETKGKRGVYRISHSEDGDHVNGVIDIPKVCVLEYYELDIVD